MKIIGLAVALMAAACGGSGSGSSGADLSIFTGATWTGTLTSTVTCGGQPPASGNANFNVPLSAGSGADLQYMSNDGCLFKFNVSGSTGSLSNGPVSCSTTSSGIAIVVTFNSYTLSTSDGHHLTINSAGTAASGGTTCSMTTTGNATR